MVDHPRDEGALMEAEVEDPQAVESVVDEGARATGGGDNGSGEAPEVENKIEQRAQVGFEAVGPVVWSLDPGTAVEGTVITSGGFGGDGGNGVGGSGDARSGSPSRDSAKGKGVAVEEERPIKVPIRQVEFRQAAGSSRHKLISQGDFVEFVDEAVLDCLLRDNPAVVTAVLLARKERQRAIELGQEEERLRAKAERARAEAELPRRKR